MSLSGKQWGELQDALLDAFRTYSDLREMLQRQLGENAALYGDASSRLPDVVFNLIQAKDAAGWLPQLVRAALDAEPDNPRLNGFARHYPELVGPPTATSGSGLPRRKDWDPEADPEAPVDIAIVTILKEEFLAVRQRLQNLKYDPGTADSPNRYAWELGCLPSAAGGSYRVVLALAARAGNVSGSQTVTATVNRWKPRYVVLVGIAGGFPRDGLRRGDVVVSPVIWGYDYGKIEQEFQPRLDFVYQVDGSLLTAATRLGIVSQAWRAALPARPDGNGEPKVLEGPVASGDKVVDNAGHPFWRAVAAAWPKLLAVEMEGAGAVAAIESARAEGQRVGFIMVRGISDMPPLETQDSGAVGSQTGERDAWKVYAANTAAAFVVDLIASGWPVPPRAGRA